MSHEQQPSRLHEFKTYVHEELISHLPYTICGIIGGLLLAAVSTASFSYTWSIDQFHLAHYAHVFFSAAASAAIFKSYQDSVFRAIPIAFLSALLLCAFSDILIPVIGLRTFGYEAHVHVCALEHPIDIALSISGGIAIGLAGIRYFKHCNRSFHSLHLLISTSASTLYMLTQIHQWSAISYVAIGFTLFFALAIPCLVGDMMLPLCFVHLRKEYLHEKVHHSHHHGNKPKEGE